MFEFAGGKDIMKMSRVLILEEMVKHLSGEMLERDCRSSSSGYSSCLKVRIPKSSGEGQMVDMLGCSGCFFRSEFEATERAAESLIYSISGEFKLEVDDLNWAMRNEFELDLERLKKENALLKKLVNSFVDGWACSLQLADSVYNISCTICSSVCSRVGATRCGEPVNPVVTNTTMLRDYTKLVWSEGAKVFNRLIDRRKDLYEQF